MKAILKKIQGVDESILLYKINLISLAGFFGSLFFSEVGDYSPCNLCWYQRIFLYPIAFITSLAIIKKDFRIFKYTLLLAIPGAIIAFYQYLLQKTDIFEHSFINCTTSNPCSEIDVQYLGFITIPLMSFVAFILIAAISLFAIKRRKNIL